MQRLINMMIKEGMPVTKKGMCVGICGAYTGGYLSGDTHINREEEEKIFFSRLQRIFKINSDVTKDNTDLVKAKSTTEDGRNQLTKDEKELLDCEALMNVISIYQNPLQIDSKFFIDEINPDQTDLESLSMVAGSKKLDEQGGLVVIHNEPVALANNQLQQYLDALKTILLNDAENSCMIHLSNGSHKIAMHYQSGDDKWLVMNPNDIESKLLDNKRKPDEHYLDNLLIDHQILANQLYGDLFFETNSVFNILATTTKNNPELNNLKTKFSEFRNNNLNNLQKNQVTLMNNNTTIPHLALKFGSMDYLEKSIDINANINLKLKYENGLTLTHYLLANDNNMLVRILLEKKVDDIDKADMVELSSEDNKDKLLNDLIDFLKTQPEDKCRDYANIISHQESALNKILPANYEDRLRTAGILKSQFDEFTSVVSSFYNSFFAQPATPKNDRVFPDQKDLKGKIGQGKK